MALPIVHATAGYLIHRLDGRRTRFQGWPRAMTYMAIGNLPDADFLVGFAVGQPGAFHRGFSHTVLAAIVFGLAAAACTRWWLRDRFWPAAAFFGIAYASHLLLDALTIDVRGPHGAQFFWPLSDAYYVAPFTLFNEILIDGRSRVGFFWSVVAWPTVLVLAREAAIALAAILALRIVLGWVRGDDEGAPALTPEPGEEDLA
jgi:membrane-bound metal-dependent hydrolase YbcI (DUF457 family)